MSEERRLERVELKDALAGRYVSVDLAEVTWGVLADFESTDMGRLLGACSDLIAEGDLPGGIGREGLGRLRPAEIRALLAGVGTAVYSSLDKKE